MPSIHSVSFSSSRSIHRFLRTLSVPCSSDKVFIDVLEISPSLVHGHVLEDEIMENLMIENIRFDMVFTVFNTQIEFERKRQYLHLSAAGNLIL